MQKNHGIEIRECTTLEELHGCQKLQSQVFGLPDIEVSPVRHLVVTRSAGGFILGAFAAEKLIGFVLSVPGFNGEKRFFYSHMTAVAKDFQNSGIGARLKWAQRDYALAHGVNLIKWTFQPVLARNAHFNLNRLGATISRYAENFYGTDYPAARAANGKLGLDSDRLYADWNLTDEKVVRLAAGNALAETGEIVRKVEIPADWSRLVAEDLAGAIAEQHRIRSELQAAFKQGLIARAFEKSQPAPRYLLFAA